MVPTTFAHIQTKLTKLYGHSNDLHFCKEVLNLKALHTKEEAWRKSTLYLGYKYLDISSHGTIYGDDAKFALLSPDDPALCTTREQIFKDETDGKIFDILVWSILSQLDHRFGPSKTNIGTKTTK
jgi:hypothetical protein